MISEYFSYLFFAILLSFIHIFISNNILKKIILLISIILFIIFSYNHYLNIKFNTGSYEEFMNSSLQGILFLIVIYFIFKLILKLF